MDYLQLMAQQEPAHLALVTDTCSLTYGQLVAEASRRRRLIEDAYQAKLAAGSGVNASTVETADAAANTAQAVGPAAHRVHFIHQERISEQLLDFLAYSGSSVVPIIATEVSRRQQFVIDEVPTAACMGVMTSGSTGKSKLLWRSYGSWADFFDEQNRIFHIDSTSTIFCQGSLAFTGNLSIYMGTMAAGGTIVATEKFRPKQWLQLMDKHAVNGIYLIPSKLLLLAKFVGQPLEAIKTIVSGSQSMGCREADKLQAAFPQADLTLYYGASELNYISYIKGCDMTEDRTDVGLPFKGVGVEIRNQEIYIDTPYHVENITIPFSLKDRGCLSKDGHLHFLGRTDDICSVNGLKISSLKVEQALMELPQITEAAVMVQHRGDADLLVAFLATGQEYSKQELLQLLRQGYLDEQELPHKFILLPELPKNESGKLDKRTLASTYL